MKFYLFVIASLLISIFNSNAQSWWERETAMGKSGELTLSEKTWWTEAANLKPGEIITIKSEFPDGGLMLIKCEKRQRGAANQQMIVWILDDDGDMDKENPAGDFDNDCYVVDYGCDGMVDRMVDYIDDGNAPGEMDIRYFVDGELRRSWFGVDFDDDASMWSLIDYEYDGDFFKSDPYGDNMIFMNKYDPVKDVWLPISECPFAFYATDDDDQSEVVVRFSAAPLSFDPDADPDYANSQQRYQGPFDSAMRSIGVVNVRYSFDIDNLSDSQTPLHYEMGFNMTGGLVYDFPDMVQFNALRRSPKKVVCIPFDQIRKVSDKYKADKTGFSWVEFPDASIRIGHSSKPEDDRRWEGVFWTWERRIMHNTGGPVQHWNIRREYMGRPSGQREMYYSPVDRRIHLKGAAEGWLKVGCISKDEILGEVRYFDVNQDGYFDRWEYFDQDSNKPYRVVQTAQVDNVDLGSDIKEISAFYNQEALPEVIRLNELLIKELDKNVDGPMPRYLQTALAQSSSPTERRYILDLIREYKYIKFQSYARELAAQSVKQSKTRDPRTTVEKRRQSENAWEFSVQLSKIDAAYESGEYQKLIALIQKLNTAAMIK
jgi:hypothetical protein